MVETQESGVEGEECSNAARDVAGRFKRSVVPRNTIDHAIRVLAPDDRPQTLVALFDGRVGYHTIRGWRKRARAPQWAVDLLRQKKSLELEAIAQMKTGPGSRAGYRNIGAWRAARNSER